MSEIIIPGGRLTVTGKREVVKRTVVLAFSDETLRQKGLSHLIFLSPEEARLLAEYLVDQAKLVEG